MTFQLDTSGYVDTPPNGGGRTATVRTRWEDLDPFTQGYVEALFRGLREGDLGYLPISALKKELRFDKLAPETLARIVEDCAWWRKAFGGRSFTRRTHGADLWKERQAGEWKSFPPLTAYLGDDGKVYLRASATA